MALKNQWTFLDFDLESKSEALLGVYGAVWTISIGVIVFVVQRGYGPVMGLSMVDILALMLDSPALVVLIMVYLLVKFPVYIAAFCYHLKCTLVWGMAESFLSLAVIIWCFLRLPDIDSVSLLLQRNIKKNMVSAKGFPDAHKWKIVKSVRNLSYDSSEECNALIDLLAVFLKEMRMPNSMPGRENIGYLIGQMDILKQVMNNICFTADGKKRLEYIVMQCIEKLSEKSREGPIIPSRGSVRRERNLQKFLLLECLMEAEEEAEHETLIRKVLDMSEPGDASEILVYLLYKLIILLKVRRENVWSRLLLRKLWRYSRQPDLVGETDKILRSAQPDAPGCRMICLEYLRHDLSGRRGITLNNFTQIACERIMLETEIYLEGSR